VRLCLVLLVICMPVLRAQDATANAIAALEHGDLKSAEQILRTHLEADPRDAASLQVLAIVLDQEKKYAEADNIYRRALVVAPRSAGLLNNYGNHLLVTGRIGQARKAFLEVLTVKPAHPNANEQLARIALEQKEPAEALAHLDRLPANVQQSFDVELLRGEALAATKDYAAAEEWFAHALDKQPGNFQALYDLGLAASHAGHNQRARDALRQAAAKQPGNVDVLYDLAAVDIDLHDRQSALALLVRARQAAPQRKDVARLLAQTTADLGYFGDAVRAWDAYLKLAPNDEAARRERAFAESAIGENPQTALADLANFVRAHPRDAEGHYELGTAESTAKPAAALAELNRAIEIEPKLASAHFARGLLRYRQGDLQAAASDFAFTVNEQPENPAALDRLAEVYLALNRAQEALPLLHKAAGLAPDNARVELHLGHALIKTGNQAEAAQAFHRYRELNTGQENVPHATGLVEFLGLSPAEQYARYRAGVERAVKQNPENAEAQVRYLGIVLNDGNVQAASEVCNKIAQLHPASGDLEDAADQLLNARQYALVEALLSQAGQTAQRSPEIEVDCALAVLHTAGPAAALAQLDQISQNARSGDYYVARAEILAASGRQVEVDTALQKAIVATPKRPQFYAEGALLLTKTGQVPEAVKLLDRGIKAVPDDAELSSMRALALGMEGASAKNRAALLDAMQSLFH
jgi:predicted Zn-dependent protease